MGDRPITVLELGEELERVESALEADPETLKKKGQAQGEDRVRNILQLEEDEPLSPSHQELADQMAKVIRGEPLHTKGLRQFRVDPTGRVPHVADRYLDRHPASSADIQRSTSRPVPKR
jgi:hypothetical protein